ncbi:MAG: hypothetical protein PHP34_07405 [Bacteroidales bacterium]|nr:hypothetical protein [Bacteroidales bacterium]
MYSILLIAVLFFSVHACNQTGNKQGGATEETGQAIVYLSVADVFEQGESLANKTVSVEGIVEHVCKHTWKRFKIVDEGGRQDLKIELGDQFPSIDASILGKKAKVTGTLVPVVMDEEMVRQWEEKMKENHKGEENTDHYKEELAFIQNIHQQLTNGDIRYYTHYTLEANQYELE